MRRIKSKIYKWISSISHRNMEDKGTEPISGSPAKSLPLTDWKKSISNIVTLRLKQTAHEARRCNNGIIPPKSDNDESILSSPTCGFSLMGKYHRKMYVAHIYARLS